MVWSEPKEVNNMEEKKNEIDTLIPRKILVPIEDAGTRTYPAINVDEVKRSHSRTEQLRKFKQE